MTSLSEGGSPPALNNESHRNVRLVSERLTVLRLWRCETAMWHDGLVGEEDFATWSEGSLQDYREPTEADLRALLYSPRAPETAPTEGDPDGLLREFADALDGLAQHGINGGPSLWLAQDMVKRARAYLSSREQPQDGT